MILIFNSCVSEEEPVAVPVSDLQQAVEDAKAWFGPQEEFEVPIKSASNARVRNQIKKIHWNKAIVHEEGRVIEVEITYNIHGVPVKGEKSPQQVRAKEKLAFYRLILEKNDKGGYEKYLMKYFPEKSVGNQSKLEVNNYMTLSKKLSGEVLLYDWEENLVKGWELAEGQIIRFFRSRVVRKGMNGENLAQECQNYSEVICINYEIIDENGDSQLVLDCSPAPVVECPGDDNDPIGDDNGPGYYYGSGGWGSGGSPGPVPGGGSGSGTSGPTLLPDDYYQSDEYWDYVFSTVQDLVLQSNPGVKDYRSMNPTQRLAHVLSHIKKAKQQGVDFKISDIMTHIPSIAPGGPFTPPGGYYESGHARFKLNGVDYTVGYLFGNRAGYNYVNSVSSPTFHDSSFMGQVNYYYSDVNYPGRSSFEIYLPMPLRPWFESNFY